jgi:predicted aspartyl protease
MRTLLILLVVFAVLLGVVYFYEIRGQKGREEAKEKEQSLLKLEKDQISEIELIRDDQSVLLRKSGNEWTIRKPIETRADTNAVEALVGALTSARIDRKLEKPGPAAEYGLAKPRLRVRVKSAKREVTLLIGAKDFTGSQVYVQAQGDPSVYLTSDYFFTASNKDLKALRNRKALVFDRDRVQSMEIQRPKELIRLKRSGERWMLESPIRDRADDSAVSGLLSALEFAEAREFVTERADDLKPYGLDKPEVTVRIREEGQDAWRTLEFGKKKGDIYYARDTGRSPIFTVNYDIFDKVSQPLWAFRDKALVDVAQDRISRISFKRADQEIVVRRQDDGKWIIEKPDRLKGKEAQSYKFWYPLSDVRFESLETPDAWSRKVGQKPEIQMEIQVTLTLKDGRNLVYEFARRGDKYLARRVDTGRTGVISKEAFDALQLKPEDLV